MRHATLLRELIERWRKESDDFERDGDEGSAASYYNCADELEVVIAALGEGQEVAPVAWPHPLGERHAAIESALKGQTLLLMSRDHVNDKKKPLAEIKFGMSTDLGVLFCLADTEAPMPVDTSPAQTSEARDAARLDWLDAKCTNVADEYGIASQLYFGTYATGKLREAIDAAMEASR